jgi:hypothetical protein
MTAKQKQAQRTVNGAMKKPVAPTPSQKPGVD